MHGKYIWQQWKFWRLRNGKTRDLTNARANQNDWRGTDFSEQLTQRYRVSWNTWSRYLNTKCGWRVENRQKRKIEYHEIGIKKSLSTYKREVCCYFNKIIIYYWGGWPAWPILMNKTLIKKIFSSIQIMYLPYKAEVCVK